LNYDPSPFAFSCFWDTVSFPAFAILMFPK
jgi:hypothetical protein